MPLKCYIYATYANYFVCIYETTMSLFIPHMISVQSIMWPGAMVYIHFTLLTYAPEQICQPHHTYMSHSTSTIVYIYTSHYCTHPLKINKLQHLCTVLLQKYVPRTNIPLKSHKFVICPNYSTCIYRGSMPMYVPHIKLFRINGLTRIAVHGWLWWRQCRMTMMPTLMPQPDHLYWVYHLDKSVKARRIR